MLVSIVSVYLIAMLALGVWCSRTRIAGATDFLLAGRRLGVVMGAGALAATHFGGGAVLGGAEYAYTYGASGAWYGISTGVGLLVLGLFTASRFRALALFTVPDYLAGRYGGRVIRIIAALLALAALVGILAAQVNAALRLLVDKASEQRTRRSAQMVAADRDRARATYRKLQGRRHS